MGLQHGRSPALRAPGFGETDLAGGSISPIDSKPQTERQASKWRQTYKVHRAADVFPTMSDEELTKLVNAITGKPPVQASLSVGNLGDIPKSVDRRVWP